MIWPLQTEEMVNWFEQRTRSHISLVQELCGLICDIDLPQVADHDSTKFAEPEYTPYIFLTWRYKLLGEGKTFIIPDELNNLIHEATLHHILLNGHHPEYWNPDQTNDIISITDRDKPNKLVDATRMPKQFLAEMVADWKAISIERNTNVLDWAKSNIGIRWGFSDDQIRFIYDIIAKVEK